MQLFMPCVIMSRIMPANAKAKGKGEKGGPKITEGGCRAWVNYGKCPRGEACPYAHDPEKGARLRSATPKKRRQTTPKGKSKGKEREATPKGKGKPFGLPLMI